VSERTWGFNSPLAHFGLETSQAFPGDISGQRRSGCPEIVVVGAPTPQIEG
jgi:hypothetical protein